MKTPSREQEKRIDPFLTNAQIAGQLTAGDKQTALLQITRLLSKNNKIHDEDTFLESLYIREKAGSTNIGCGVAIPHGVSDTVVESSLVVGKLKNSMDWDCPNDRHPVCLIICFAVRSDRRDLINLRIIAQITSALADDQLLKRLVGASTKRELKSLLLRSIASI